MVTKIDNSPEARKERYFRTISDSLQSIAKNISYEMGPFKKEELVNPSEEMKKEWDRQQELDHLRESNEIASRTAKYAVWGLIITAVIGAFQLAFSVWEHIDSKNTPQEKIIVIQEKETPSPTPEVATESAKVN